MGREEGPVVPKAGREAHRAECTGRHRAQSSSPWMQITIASFPPKRCKMHRRRSSRWIEMAMASLRRMNLPRRRHAAGAAVPVGSRAGVGQTNRAVQASSLDNSRIPHRAANNRAEAPQIGKVAVPMVRRVARKVSSKAGIGRRHAQWSQHWTRIAIT